MSSYSTKPKGQTDELTTEMHYDLHFEGFVSKKDFYCAAIYGAIRGGESKANALKRYGISEDYYDANIERILHDTSW